MTWARRMFAGSMVLGVSTTWVADHAAAVACMGFFDANGDGFADYPIGSPGENIGSVGNAGLVTVLMGTDTNAYTGTGSLTIKPGQVGQPAEANDRFGASVEVIDWNPADDLCPDLAIGIPGEDGGAGRVVVVMSSPDGLNLASRVVLEQGRSGTPDTPDPGDRFGETMATSGLSVAGTAFALVVGVPGEDVAGAADAGVVDTFRFSSTNGKLSPTGVVVRQGAGGVPDAAEPGDGFGSSLAGGGAGFGSQVLAIGVPGEDVSGVTDAGLVHQFDGEFEGHLELVTQGSPDIPDSNETGDRFGTAVGYTLGCSETVASFALAVGTPGEDLSGLSDVGAVTVSERGNPADTGNLLRQGAAPIGGNGEAGDRFGASLAFVQLELAIGTPGEDLGAATDTGSVSLVRQSCSPQSPGTNRDVVFPSNREITQNTTGVPEANEDGDRLGARLGLGRNSFGLPSLVVAAPSEAIGAAAGAGSVLVFPTSQSTSTVLIASGRAFNQDSSGVGDVAEAGDGFGNGLDSMR